MLITGAAGRIGRAVQACCPEAVGIDVADGDLVVSLPTLRPTDDTVIHLAGALDEGIDPAEASIRMMMNVLRACRAGTVRRLIIASSMRADEPLAGFPSSYYGASKIAQEAMLRAWCVEDPTRIGVALRFGYFGPGGLPPVEHEVFRLDEAMLAYWIGRALSTDQPGMTTLLAVGKARL